MRIVLCLVVVTATWAQVPVVRDAFLEINGKVSRNRAVRLKDDLKVVVCSVEYEDWRRSQQDPAVSLYLDGKLMNAKPDRTPGTTYREDESKVEKYCFEKKVGQIAAAQKEADQPEATATEAETARKRVDALKRIERSVYIFSYYLDPRLAAKAETKEPWLRLLEKPWEKRPVAVSLGLATGGAWPTDVSIPFERLNLLWLTGWALLFGIGIVWFVKFARNSDILRDSGELAPEDAEDRKAYSLARTQMALWTFLVAGGLAFIFMVTWNENTITPGILVLIGISFGTTLLAATAEGPPKPQKTNGFINDLLSDDNSPSFHRYQMVLFTIILAVIFIAKTASGLTMPEFDQTLLGLMGISSGTYLGFKLQGR